jgi:site-specific recombinase XerD
MIEAVPNLAHRSILMVLYATGIRRTEASFLKVSDVDSERMVIHVRQGNGFRDHDVPMTTKLLEALRDYWRWKRPKYYLFPSTEGHRGIEQPISDHTVWYICSEPAKRAGIKKRIGAHTPRHSFATILMESGADLRTIELLMGHASLEHTTLYLHMSQCHLGAASNQLDQITVENQRFSRKRTDDYQA